MFKNNRAQYILDGTVCRGLGGPVYCGKEFNFPADLPAQFARILQHNNKSTIINKIIKFTFLVFFVTILLLKKIRAL